MSGQNLQETLAQIESTWSSLVPGRPFDYYFLDESLDKLYRSEQNFRTVFSAMTLLSVIIACLGLFGLAAFTAEQRTKEIGIRKVLGATVSGVTVLLSKDFAKLVMIAYVIACPIAWYAMQKWLQGFAYRIDMGWWVFALAGGLALVIALLTVSTQAIKAALANPVASFILRFWLSPFPVSAFAAERRTKEIGVRKVFGATVANIVSMLLRDFVKLVLAANLIAWPVAYFAE
jgi:putative ABC transport system permease protein